ncbi:MFS transporter [Prauserella muralis]|uniref:Putative proline/betaine transporter n=1 Tax=Prauserella muralis TaxID=588067 RepID=A0A2V4B7X9_9PSEU|nr:MFS transporter [Prauserella muralis]PXY31347.1 MFS transporter [Prauserella muralis]TWE14331.1 MHS family proline/betaine transporter-like MFS transporter [Prauserella muralis]
MAEGAARSARATTYEPSAEDVRKAVAGSAMGNCIEWYDFGVFGFMPAILGQVFFNAASTEEGALATFALLAVTFVIRPFGSFVLGPLGDKLGRQRVLALTVILMSGSTFAIGLLPTWETIGPLAAVLVIVLRSLQGFSAGGEYGGAATFIAEYAPDRRRGFLGSWLEFGTLVGFFLGAGAVTLSTVVLGQDAMQEWGWRIPFLVAGPLGLVGLYLRTRLEDTPVFREIAKQHKVAKSPLKELFARHWRSILHLIGLVILLNVGDWIMLAYVETYLKDVLGMSGNTPLLIVMGVILAMLAVIVPIGGLSDRIGRKPILMACCAGFLVLPVPAFTLMENSKTEQGINVAMLAGGLAMIGACLVLFLAVVASTLPAMFPTQVRYGAFSIGYNVSTAAFAGTAPYIVGSLVDATGNTLWPAFYLMGAAAIATVPVLLLPETNGVALRDIVNSRMAVSKTAKAGAATAG